MGNGKREPATDIVLTNYIVKYNMNVKMTATNGVTLEFMKLPKTATMRIGTKISEKFSVAKFMTPSDVLYANIIENGGREWWNAKVTNCNYGAEWDAKIVDAIRELYPRMKEMELTTKH